MKQASTPSGHVKGQDYGESDQKIPVTDESDEESSKIGSTRGKGRKNKPVSAYSKGSSAFGQNDQASTKEDGASKTGRQSDSSIHSRKLQGKSLGPVVSQMDYSPQEINSFETFKIATLSAYRRQKSVQSSHILSNSTLPSKTNSLLSEVSNFIPESLLGWCVLDTIFNLGELESDKMATEMVETLLNRLGFAEQLVSHSLEGAEMFAEINLSSIRAYTGRAKGGALAEGISMYIILLTSGTGLNASSKTCAKEPC